MCPRGEKIIITGSRGRLSAPAGAEWWAERLGAEIVPRGRDNLRELAEKHGAWAVIAIQAQRVTLYVPAEGMEYFYHPGMAKRRVRNIQQGMGDPMVSAMRLEEGDRVLDCTLGRGTDAIVASYVVGESGKVVGLESVRVIAAMTEHGLRTFRTGVDELDQAMRRIEVVWADNADYLRRAEEKSFDVVYFDPLFHKPVEGSSAMVPLRKLADKRPLSAEALERALAIARRCVVVKQRRGTPLWRELEPDETVAGKRSSIEYGVFMAQNA